MADLGKVTGTITSLEMVGGTVGAIVSGVLFDATGQLRDRKLGKLHARDLAAWRDGMPVAERFELYLGPLELANGYHELTDAAEQRLRFERDVATRSVRGEDAPAIDEGLLAALAHGMPDCAGVALGVDRLLMAMLDTPRIADVVAFDFARA